MTDTNQNPDLQREVAELRAERARLWEELHRERADQRELEYHRNLTAQMQGSLSWRLTAPLRVGKTISVKVRRKLRERQG